MLDNFGIETLKLVDEFENQKSVDECITILSKERDRLDIEINQFRKIVLHPTKYEHRYFVKLKDARKKIQMEIKRIKRLDRRVADAELHTNLGIMTKNELKDWRVISHKLFNVKQNVENIWSKIHELKTYSKFTGLVERLQEDTTRLDNAISYYKTTVDEIEHITTKHYYRDKEIADAERIRRSSTTERETSKEDVTV